MKRRCNGDLQGFPFFLSFKFYGVVLYLWNIIVGTFVF